MKRFKLKLRCKKSDPLNWIEKGKVYEFDVYGGSYIIHINKGCFELSKENIKEHFELKDLKI